jgi:hypothetical protein
MGYEFLFSGKPFAGISLLLERFHLMPVLGRRVERTTQTALMQQRHHRMIEVSEFLIIVEEAKDNALDSERIYLNQIAAQFSRVLAPRHFGLLLRRSVSKPLCILRLKPLPYPNIGFLVIVNQRWR